mmetsp:Transcript_16865/g.34783  ORF Transcript_16865/g.34783 Transcript_16865/m.34783 type:complete len:242 (-) Transcript_16865:1333-2058(-)
MTLHTQFAFVEKCSNTRRQGNIKRWHRPACLQRESVLYGSVDGFVPEGSVAAGSMTQTIPTASFDTTSTFEPVVFEPVLNVPALITFVLITTVFSALIVRTNQVEDAVQMRKRRQEQVRALKAREVGEGQVPPKEIQQTLQLYEDAVRQEEKLRNILPGVRIVPPSSSDRREEEAQAIAKQYLGQDFNIGVPKRYNEKRDDEGSLPSVAIGVLAMVALSQVGLLAFFNFGADPMSGNGALM